MVGPTCHPALVPPTCWWAPSTWLTSMTACAPKTATNIAAIAFSESSAGLAAAAGLGHPGGVELVIVANVVLFLGPSSLHLLLIVLLLTPKHPWDLNLCAH